MSSADRSMIVLQMTSLRPSAASQLDRSCLPHWHLFKSAESRILEIVELVAVLRADGFSETEVFHRLRKVQGMTRVELKAMRDPLEVSVVDYLRQYDRTYLDLGEKAWRSALSMAKVWAETFAQGLAQSNWPPSEILGERAKGGLKALDDYLNGTLGRDVRRLRARAVSGDELWRYSTEALMWTLMMGSGGYALLRGGRSVDYIQTRMS
jgi:hypothetical protein